MWTFKIFPFLLISVFGRPNDNIKGLNPRIIGGHDTNITEVPWQLLHLQNGTESCGGVIIGPKEVLSAGHCYALGTSDTDIHQYRAGTNIRNKGGIVYDVESYVVHPEFTITDGFIYHDITFVRMKQPFNFSEFIQPIKLADKEPEDGAEALISGFGITYFSNNTADYPKILQSLKIPVVEKEKCKEWYSDYFWAVQDDQVCVGTFEGGLGACSGDSGGPMVVNNELVGLTSWADPCGKPHHPTVYTSIPYYKDWIQQQLDSKN